MSSNAASYQPRKRGRKAWMIGLACVVAVVTIVLLANAPRKEPVRVWFVRATNEGGEKRLVFEGTNGMAGAIEFDCYVILGAIPRAKPTTNISAIYRMNIGSVAARTHFDFALDAPRKDVPY